MKIPVIILFTITNKQNDHILGIYNLKAYLLDNLTYSSKPRIFTKIIKAHDTYHNKETVIFDLTDYEINRTIEWLLNKEPTIIGFSCWLSNSRLILKIAKAIKKKDNRIKIIIGGPETNQNRFFNPQELMKKEEYIDIIVRYDGEEILLELVESIVYQKYKLNDIKGIIYRKGRNIIINQVRPPMELSQIPSPYVKGLIKINKGTKEIVMENTRGCPYRCNYCIYPLGNYSKFRRFPLDRVKNELIYLFNKNLNFINIVDSNFNVDEERAKKILKMIIKYNKKHINIGVFYNASKKKIDDELITLFELSKLTLTIGVQSTNSRALKTANRQTNIDILEGNLRRLDKKNVRYCLEFIFGLPEDSLVNINNTINWIFKFQAKRVIFYRLCVLKGTHFHYHAKELGLDYYSNPPYYIKKNRTLSTYQLNKLSDMLRLVTFFYNYSVLRKIIIQINKIFGIDYATIFRELIIWNKSPELKCWDKKYAYKIGRRFMIYLFKTNRF